MPARREMMLHSSLISLGEKEGSLFLSVWLNHKGEKNKKGRKGDRRHFCRRCDEKRGEE